MMEVYVVKRCAVYGEREDIVAVVDKRSVAELLIEVADKAESAMYTFKYEKWEVM